MKKTIRLTESELTNIIRNVVNEAVDGGWEVDDMEAGEAYEFACNQLGKESVDEQIINCLSSTQLAECLAFIFRMNDFREWDEYKQSKY